MIIVTLAGLGVGGALVTAPVYMTEVSPPLARSRLMLGGQVVGFGFVILVASVPALYLLPAYPGAVRAHLCGIPAAPHPGSYARRAGVAALA